MKQLFILCLSFMMAGAALAQTKTVTNADLQKFKEKRVEAEKNYRENYAKMGFPSPEELEKQNEQKRLELERVSTQLQTERLQAENDIVSQANVLRAQIASLDAQINYLRRGQTGNSYSSPVILSYGYVPSYGFRNFRPGFSGRRPQLQQLPPNMRTVQEYANMYPSSQSLYNQSIGNVRLGTTFGGFRGGRIDDGRRGYYRGGYVAPVIVGGGNYSSTDFNSQLVYLEQQRAGLLAEWRILAEEARRAGVRID